MRDNTRMWLFSFAVLLCILSNNGSVITNEDEKQQTVGNPSPGLTVDGLRHLITMLNKNLIALKNDPSAESGEKEKIKEIEVTLSNMDSRFIEELKNNKDKDKRGEIVNKYQRDIVVLKKDIDQLNETKYNRESVKFSEECVEAIKNKNFELASKMLDKLKDDRIDWIVNNVYNKENQNYYLISNFVSKIASTSKCLLFYKTLRKEVQSNTQIDEDTRIELNLQLIMDIQNNLFPRTPEDGIIRTEAEKIIEDLKNELKPLASSLLIEAINQRWVSEKADAMAEKIIYKIKDYKFFRDIAETVARSVYPRRDFEQTLVTMESMTRILPRLIWLKALYDQIAEYGVTVNTIDKLLLTQHAAQKAKEKVENDFEVEATDVWNSMPDVKILVMRLFKKSLLESFYSENDVDNLSNKIFLYDKDVFESIIKAVVKNIYGKMSTVELLRQFRGSSRIGQSVPGYNAVFEQMNENGHLVLNAQNVGPLLKLSNLVTETLGMNNLKNEDPIMRKYLDRMKRALPNLREEVIKTIKNSIIEGNYTTEEHANFSINIFEVGQYGNTIKTVISDLYNQINNEKLFDYIRSQKNPGVRLRGFFALQEKISANSGDLFEVARSYRKIVDSDEYKSLNSNFRGLLEVYKYMLPASIRNAAFGEKIYVKNLSRGGEYLYLERIFNHDNQKRPVFTWIPGNRVNQSQWVLEETDDAGVYKFKNVDCGEYLYASQHNFDHNRRRTFSSTSGDEESKWRLIPTSGGVYIKNDHYNEYLFAGKHIRDSSRRHVFTWTPKGEIPDAKWVFEEFLTSY